MKENMKVKPKKGQEESHTTIRVSRSFRDYLAENAPKAQTYEEFIAEHLEIED